MACQKDLYVLLGFEDEFINEKHKSTIDFTTNKIGGKPDWCQPTNLPLTKCRLCGTNLPLLIQIYAPLENSKYHRTLYVFACIQPSCWNRNESWLCVRQQVSCKAHEGASLAVTESSSSVSFWNADADNWDSEDEVIPSVDQENGNVVMQRPHKPQRVQEDTDTDDSSLSVEEPNDPNANSAGAEGAFAIEFSNKVNIASAEIEIGDESEIVSIDTPIHPQPVSELFISANSQLRNISHPEFMSSFISVSEEISQSHLSKPTEHEMSLLQQYQQSELGGGDFNVDGRMRGAEGGGGELTLEQYEKELPSHGDRLAHRFISRLQQAPGQILRYGRDAEPLLLQPLPKGHSPTCQHCGGDLSFELQLLPALLAKLSLVTKDERCRDIGHTGLLEFGTVLFYTCREACWTPDEAGYREERVVVQAETL